MPTEKFVDYERCVKYHLQRCNFRSVPHKSIGQTPIVKTNTLFY